VPHANWHAVTILGFTFSGMVALALVVVALVIAGAWFLNAPDAARSQDYCPRLCTDRSGPEGARCMEGLSPLHLIILLVVALLVIGPGKLPEVGAALGKTIREFRSTVSGVQEAVRLDAPPAPPAPASAAIPPAALPAPTAAPVSPSAPPDPAAPVPAHPAPPADAS